MADITIEGATDGGEARLDGQGRLTVGRRHAGKRVEYAVRIIDEVPDGDA